MQKEEMGLISAAMSGGVPFVGLFSLVSENLGFDLSKMRVL